MTDNDTERQTLGEMSHTNPYTGEVFGSTQTYSRGTTVAADGGEANAVDEETGKPADEAGETIADVDHEPPKDAESANAAYQRGNEDDA